MLIYLRTTFFITETSEQKISEKSREDLIGYRKHPDFYDASGGHASVNPIKILKSLVCAVSKNSSFYTYTR